jgi:hypothetical protein
MKQAMSRRQIHPDLFSGRIVQTTDLQTSLQDANILPISLVPGLNSVISIGGIVVNALGANIAVGIITNPANAADQGIVAAESLFVDPYGNAGLSATGTTFELKPGQSWFAIPYQTTITTVNAVTTGHKFSAVQGTNP